MSRASCSVHSVFVFAFVAVDLMADKLLLCPVESITHASIDSISTGAEGLMVRGVGVPHGLSENGNGAAAGASESWLRRTRCV